MQLLSSEAVPEKCNRPLSELGRRLPLCFIAVLFVFLVTAPLRVSHASNCLSPSIFSPPADPTFGEGGEATIDGFDGCAELMVRRDGMLLASSGARLARLTAGGQLDSGFGGTGVVDLGAWMQGIREMTLRDDNRIVVLGSVDEGSILLQLEADGTLDETFRSRTIAWNDVGILLQADQRIVVSGNTIEDENRLHRYLPDGSIDTTFGENGSVVVPGEGGIAGVVQQSKGRLLVLLGGWRVFAVLGYTADGAPDPTFLFDPAFLRDFVPGSALGIEAIDDDSFILNWSRQFCDYRRFGLTAWDQFEPDGRHRRRIAWLGCGGPNIYEFVTVARDAAGDLYLVGYLPLFPHFSGTPGWIRRLGASSLSAPRTRNHVVQDGTNVISAGPGEGNGILWRGFFGCGNGAIDAGEVCDDGKRLDGDCCSHACQAEQGTCDDGDAATIVDQCYAGACVNGFLAVLEEPCVETLPTKLSRRIRRNTRRAERVLKKADRFSAKGKSAKVEKLRKRAKRQLGAIAKSARRSKKISDVCANAIDVRIQQQQRLVTELSFTVTTTTVPATTTTLPSSPRSAFIASSTGVLD